MIHISYIVHYHLPPYFKCPLDYLKKVLNGEKKVRFDTITNEDHEAGKNC